MKKEFLLLCAAIILSVSGCGNTISNEKSNSSNESKHEDVNMEMNHSGSYEVPENMKVADHPKFKVGSTAIIEAAHMKGMKDATATIVGAYDTTAYEISYTPANGGEKVENHKWVTQEEIKDSSDKILKPGTDVILEADHMKGMKGAKAAIESAEKTTVYMIDYMPTTGAEKVTNHKWVTESELSVQ